MEKSDLRKLAEFIHNITWNDLPDQVQETVVYRVLDLVSVCLLYTSRCV